MADEISVQNHNCNDTNSFTSTGSTVTNSALSVIVTVLPLQCTSNVLSMSPFPLLQLLIVPLVCDSRADFGKNLAMATTSPRPGQSNTMFGESYFKPVYATYIYQYCCQCFVIDGCPPYCFLDGQCVVHFVKMVKVQGEGEERDQCTGFLNLQYSLLHNDHPINRRKSQT